MEFTKRSNLGALLAAVLVGLLSLCINHVFRATPEDIDRLLRRFKEVTSRVSEDATPTPGRPPAQLLDDLTQVKAAMDQEFKTRAHLKSFDPSPIKQLGDILATALKSLEHHSETTSTQLHQGRMLAFKALFLAAEMLPLEYSELFQQVGDRILQDDSELAEKRQVQLLLGFHECKIFQDDKDDAVLERLKSFARRQTDASLAIDFFVTVAQEMQKKGRLRAARAILRHGIEIYQDHPEKRKLVNQLIDIQIETAPPRFH